MNKLFIDLNNVNDFKQDQMDIQFSPGYIKELEHKIKVLEHQNSLLQSYKSECDRLNIELKHVTTLKDTYEEKYNEASMKLIYIEDDDSLVFTESEQMKTLNEKVKILLHANEDLRKEAETSKSEVEQLKKDSKILKEKLKTLESSFNCLKVKKNSWNVEKRETFFIKTRSVEKFDKEISTDPENLHQNKRKSVSIGDDLREHQFFIEKTDSFDKSDKSIGKKSENRMKHAKEPEKLVKRKKSLEMGQDIKNFKSNDFEQFSKTFSNPINIKIHVEKVFSPVVASSISPVTRDINSPKFKNKLALSRQSPKVKGKKQKSIYIPSFMRKATKLVKK